MDPRRLPTPVLSAVSCWGLGTADWGLGVAAAESAARAESDGAPLLCAHPMRPTTVNTDAAS